MNIAFQFKNKYTSPECLPKVLLNGTKHRTKVQKRLRVIPKAVPVVTAERFYHENCLLVKWEPIDTGSCLVEYTVQFMYNSRVLGIVREINYTRKQICDIQYLNATYIVIWATYNGIKGVESAANVTLFITSTLPGTTTTTPRSASSTARDVGERDSGKTIMILVIIVVLLVIIIIIILLVFVIKWKKKEENTKPKTSTDRKKYPGVNTDEQRVISVEAPQYTEIAVSMKAIRGSKIVNLNGMSETNLNKESSNYVNQQPNYVNQPSIYINQSKNETSCYAALQDGGWTKNDYQHLQGMDQGSRLRKKMNQENPISQEEYQGTSDCVSIHSTPHLKYNTLPYTNCGNEVTKSSHYMNQQINHAKNTSNYINVTDTEVDRYAALRHTDLS